MYLGQGGVLTPQKRPKIIVSAEVYNGFLAEG